MNNLEQIFETLKCQPTNMWQLLKNPENIDDVVRITIDTNFNFELDLSLFKNSNDITFKNLENGLNLETLNHIKNFDNIKTIYFYNVKIKENDFHDFLSKFKNLENITISDVNISNFSNYNLPKLKKLNLKGKYIRNIDNNKCENLEEFSLKSSEFFENLEPVNKFRNLKRLVLESLPKLEHINLNLNKLETLFIIFSHNKKYNLDLPNLNKIFMHYTDFNDFSLLKNSKKLEIIDMENGKTNNLDYIENFKLLKKVKANKCKIEKIPYLNNCLELKQVDLSFNKITTLENIDLKNLKNLKEINLIGNELRFSIYDKFIMKYLNSEGYSKKEILKDLYDNYVRNFGLPQHVIEEQNKIEIKNKEKSLREEKRKEKEIKLLEQEKNKFIKIKSNINTNDNETFNFGF